MNMETTNLSTSEWLQKFVKISKEELQSSNEVSDDEDSVLIVNHRDDDDDDDDSEDSYYDNEDDSDENKNQELESRYDLRMIRMAPLFASQPRLEKICKDWENEFLRTSFTKYSFSRNENDSVNELHEKANDLEYLVNLCGSNLTSLNVQEYPTSQIMPIINANCPNLKGLAIGFEKMMSKDFENVFSNMSHLKHLIIDCQCENSNIPMTFIKSLEQLAGTLENITLICNLRQKDKYFSPDIFFSVFPRLTTLKILEIDGFALSQLLLQSIGEMNSLEDLRLETPLMKDHPTFDARISMYPIGNLKNLKKLIIRVDYGVRDEFLINLCDNAKKLELLILLGPDITDIGMSAINNLKELQSFNLGLTYYGQENVYITDKSIQCLYNQKLERLNISNCSQITDESVMKVVENLPNLRCLFIKNTKVTPEAVSEFYKLSKHRKVPLGVH